MEYTAEQYLERIENKRLNSTPLYSREEMIGFAEKYAKQLRIGDVSKSLNMEHNATSVEYAEAIIDMHKNPENSNRDFKIVVIENTIDKLRQDLANI